jgi:AcrR family transcriptional regulator
VGVTNASPASGASSPTRPRGRPRDAERDEAILTACLELVSEVGFDRLRVQDVADRAGVGLATIYRRWPTKRDLLLHVVSAHKKPNVPLTGDARRDLLTLLALLADELTSKSAEFIPSILAALRDDPELGEAIRQNSLCEMRLQFQAILRQEPSLSEADVGPAMLLHRVLFMGDATDDALIGAIADVMLGVTSRSRPGSSRKAAAKTPARRAS